MALPQSVLFLPVINVHTYFSCLALTYGLAEGFCIEVIRVY